MTIDPHIVSFLRTSLVVLIVVIGIFYFKSRENAVGDTDPDTVAPDFDPDLGSPAAPAAPSKVTRRFVCYNPGTTPPPLK